MIIRSMRKVLTGTALVTCLLMYAVPSGFCAVTGVAKVQTQVNKPVLRKPVATPSSATVANPSMLKLEGDISITKGNPKISLSLRDSDVQQVLRMFADKAGLNIVFHDSVTGKVTLDLVNVPLNDAFKLVMQVADMTYYVDRNTMVVTSSSVAKTLNLSKQEMAAIPVKYTDASVIAEFLNKNIFSINKPGLSNSEVAITNPSANEVLIFGTDNDVRMAKKVISQFDVKPREESFVVNHTTPKEMSDLLCTVLFQSGGASGSGSGGGSTGGAAGEGLSLGAGTVACTVSGKTSAGSLSSLNANNLTIAYFAQRGTISATGGSAQQMEMIKDFILKNDKKQPQAYLELSILELSESGTRQFDNTWQLWSKNFSANFNGTTVTNPVYPTFFKNDQFDVVDSTDPSKVKYSIKQFSGTPTLTYAINYIMQNGKGRVLANPRIMITNGEVSTIDLTSDYVKSVTSQVLASSGGLASGVQRTYQIANDDGIKIDLTPFISPDGYVTLNIKPEYATIKEKIYATGAAGTQDLMATLLQRRNLDLKNVRIKDGETLIIGGMIREDEQKTVSKIPVLGDLPGVGFFFRNTGSTKTKQELVIMITPKIIKDSEDLVNNSDVTL